MAPEAITRQDGASKNDCERNAAKRLLERIRHPHPQLKLIVVENALAANGPHLELLGALGLRYIICVKEGGHEALFEVMQERLRAGTCEEFEYTNPRGVIHGFRFANDLPLNKSHPHVWVNFLEYWTIDGDEQRLWSWITDIPLIPDNVTKIMRGGCARWKIENETFNTLKNQGYHLEHNYAYGQQHLATVFAYLTLLAFHYRPSAGTRLSALSGRTRAISLAPLAVGAATQFIQFALHFRLGVAEESNSLRPPRPALGPGHLLATTIGVR